jgi:hypothetical protein
VNVYDLPATERLRNLRVHAVLTREQAMALLDPTHADPGVLAEARSNVLKGRDYYDYEHRALTARAEAEADAEARKQEVLAADESVDDGRQCEASVLRPGYFRSHRCERKAVVIRPRLDKADTKPIALCQQHRTKKYGITRYR